MFQAQDGPLVVAVGNDMQFRKLCELLGMPELPDDARFRTNPLRVKHRAELVPRLEAAFAQQPIAAWIENLTRAGVPCGPIYSIPQVFEDPHVRHRGMRVDVPHPRAGTVPMLANPARLSATPPSYDRVPPRLGEHTAEVLREVIGLSEAEIDSLARAGIT